MAECVCEAAVQQSGHLLALGIGEACVQVVGLGILEVDLLVCDIQVAAIDYGFRAVQVYQVLAQSVFPLHTVWKPLGQLAFFVGTLAVGRVAADKVEIFHFKGDKPSFLVVLLDSHAVCYV